MGALISGITLQLARAGHSEAVKVADAHYPGWRDKPWNKLFIGTWNEDFTVFTSAPPAFQEDAPADPKAAKAAAGGQALAPVLLHVVNSHRRSGCAVATDPSPRT